MEMGPVVIGDSKLFHAYIEKTHGARLSRGPLG